MITKLVVKDYVARKCPYLTSLELEEKTLINLLKQSAENQKKYRELVEEEKSESSFDNDGDDDFNLYDALKEYPELKKEIINYQASASGNAVEKLINEYDDEQLVSVISRRYFELKYSKDACARCDIDDFGNELLDQKEIIKRTNEAILNKNIKVVFEGQIDVNNMRARFDVLIKNEDGSFNIIEVKSTRDVFEHPTKKDEKQYNIDSKIKEKYLYDLLFQYYVYSKSNLINNIKELGYMFTNRNYQLRQLTFPVCDNELDDLFVIKKFINLQSGTISLKQYFDDHLYSLNITNKKVEKVKDTIEEIVDQINEIDKNKVTQPKVHYLCKKTPSCEFIKMCFENADDPNFILNLTNWNKYGGNYRTMMELIGLNVDKISQISPNPYTEFKKNGGRSNVHQQVEYQKGSIEEKYVISQSIIEEIIKKDYFNDSVDYLVFFDFESFQYPIPLVQYSNPWQQVVCQYSMHTVKKGYDLSKHDFAKGDGGGIKHYEYIGNPDIDKYENPSIKLFKTLKSQLEDFGIDPSKNNYRVVVFNQNFEKTRMNEFVDEFKSICDNQLIQFVTNFNDNVVDLLDFFTSGGFYCRDFKGKGSLKVVQPTLAADKNVIDFYKYFDLAGSLEYHNNLVYNGSICLDLYKSLLLRSHNNRTSEGPSTKDLLKEALAYCKIDSWGTVIIFDIIKNVYEGKLKLDARYLS